MDFVVYGPSGFWAIEVKHGATIRPQSLRSLKSFRQDYPEAAVRLVYQGSETLKVDGIRCLPCETFLQAIRPGEPLP